MIPREESARDELEAGLSTSTPVCARQARADGVRRSVSFARDFFPAHGATETAARHRGNRPAFTLVELLVVMAIIVVTASLIVPAAGPVLRGTQLNQATQMVADQLGLARQKALAKNHSVEVRFYQFGVADAGETPTNPASGSYRAMQLFEITDAGPVAMGKVQRLPEPIVINSTQPANSEQSVSTLITLAKTDAIPTFTTTSQPPLPGVSSYNSVAFRFFPDGSTNISAPTKPWFLTLQNITDRGQVKTNFTTIQIDPYNGHLRTFRP